MSSNDESNYEEEYRKSSIALFVRGYKCCFQWKPLWQYLHRITSLYIQHGTCRVFKISKRGSFLKTIFFRSVKMNCFVTGLGCHYSPLHFKLRTQNTLARIQFLQQHFQCHNQYYSRLTVSVCKHTAPLCTPTSVLLLLGVLQCCDQNSVPVVPHQITYRTAGLRGTYQNCRTNVNIWNEIRFHWWIRGIL